jgi:hypothetical protein
MDMNEHLIADLSRFVDERGVTICETPGHVRLNVVRTGVSVSLLIPRGVLEWWVEVNDMASGKKIEDWCDYVGCAAGEEREVTQDMRTDVLRFIENVVSRPLRTAANGRILEWNVGGDWLRAVPLVPERAAGDERNARA